MEDRTLSRREQQIMDVVYALGTATASDCLRLMPAPPSRSAVRTFLTLLEQRGHLRHRNAGRAYVYEPTASRRSAGKSALKRVLEVFFGGSLENAVAAHLADAHSGVSEEELRRLSALIDQARKKGR